MLTSSAKVAILDLYPGRIADEGVFLIAVDLLLYGFTGDEDDTVDLAFRFI